MKKTFVITILMVLAVTIANAQTALKKVYDETIDPSSTYQLVNALIKANKEFKGKGGKEIRDLPIGWQLVSLVPQIC